MTELEDENVETKTTTAQLSKTSTQTLTTVGWHDGDDGK